MWILILTLVASSSSTGQTLAAVPGFTSESSCMAAAENWIKLVKASGDFRQPRALCAKA
jgi:hypothetical protein